MAPTHSSQSSVYVLMSIDSTPTSPGEDLAHPTLPLSSAIFFYLMVELISDAAEDTVLMPASLLKELCLDLWEAKELLDSDFLSLSPDKMDLRNNPPFLFPFSSSASLCAVNTKPPRDTAGLLPLLPVLHMDTLVVSVPGTGGGPGITAPVRSSRAVPLLCSEPERREFMEVRSGERMTAAMPYGTLWRTP